MFFLPKMDPSDEHINHRALTGQNGLPDILAKVGAAGFTGFLFYSSPAAEAYCVYIKGKLVGVASREHDRIKSGFDGIIHLFDAVLESNGTMKIYRLHPDIAVCVYAQLMGKKLYHGDEVRKHDIAGLLSRLKVQEMHGLVHFYTAQRDAVIYFKKGLPIGFYHDRAKAIELNQDESRKIASLPGARLEVCSSKNLDELLHVDYIHMVNMAKLWVAALDRHEQRKREQPRRRPAADDGVISQTAPAASGLDATAPPDPRLEGMVEDLIEVAKAYLSKEGRGLIIDCLREAGGATILYDPDKTGKFLKQVEQLSYTIDGEARIQEMIDLMSSEIAIYLER